MDFNVKNNIYIITGASSGLGRETAKLLDSMGAKVIAISRNEEKLSSLKNECKTLEYKIFDFSKQEGISNLIDSIVKEFGKINGIAYFAGIGRLEPLRTESIYDVKSIFDIHFFSFYEMVRVLCDKRKSQDLSIVAISSISSICSFQGLSAYATAKGTINAFVKTAVSELAKYGIRINAILPGDIETDMSNEGRHKQSSSFSRGSNTYPLGVGYKSDVAYFTSFILSPLSRWMSGQIISIDGGYSSTKE